MTSSEVLTFSAEPGEGRDPRQLWRAYMGEVYFKLDIMIPKDDGFRGGLKKRTFADASVSWLEADDQRVDRRKSLINDDNIECFCLVMPVRGDFVYRQRKRENKATPGEIYILNAFEAYQVDLSSDPEMLCLSLPSDLLRTRIRGIDDLCGSRDFADPVMVSTLRQIVAGSLEMLPNVDVFRLQDLCLEVIDMMILRPGNRTDPATSYSFAVALGVAERARRYIETRFASPSLNVVETAAACGVSLRHLQSSFQKLGTTFGSVLLDVRLKKAYSLLRNQENFQPIGKIADLCGFTNQSHFSTCYRKRFGYSPRDERMKV